MTVDPTLPRRLSNRIDPVFTQAFDVEELVIVSAVDGHDVTITAGRSEFTVDVRGLNMILAAVIDPKFWWEKVREEMSHSADELTELVKDTLVNAPNPYLVDGEFASCRSKGYVQKAAEAVSMIIGDDPDDLFDAIRLIAQTTQIIGIGVNPLRPMKEFYTDDEVFRLDGGDEVEQTDEHDAESAATAGW